MAERATSAVSAQWEALCVRAAAWAHQGPECGWVTEEECATYRTGPTKHRYIHAEVTGLALFARLMAVLMRATAQAFACLDCDERFTGPCAEARAAGWDVGLGGDGRARWFCPLCFKRIAAFKEAFVADVRAGQAFCDRMDVEDWFRFTRPDTAERVIKQALRRFHAGPDGGALMALLCAALGPSPAAVPQETSPADLGAWRKIIGRAMENANNAPDRSFDDAVGQVRILADDVHEVCEALDAAIKVIEAERLCHNAAETVLFETAADLREERKRHQQAAVDRDDLRAEVERLTKEGSHFGAVAVVNDIRALLDADLEESTIDAVKNALVERDAALKSVDIVVEREDEKLWEAHRNGEIAMRERIAQGFDGWRNDIAATVRKAALTEKGGS